MAADVAPTGAPPAALRLTAMDAATAARALSAAFRRLVTEDQVRRVVEDGGLARADGTFSLIDYVAFLAGGDGEAEVADGRDD